MFISKKKILYTMKYILYEKILISNSKKYIFDN